MEHIQRKQNMKITYEVGDVVELGEGIAPQVVVIFGELSHPSEGGTVYVVGTEKLFGLPIKSPTFRKIGVNLAAADSYRKRYLEKSPDGLKDLL